MILVAVILGIIVGRWWIVPPAALLIGLAGSLWAGLSLAGVAYFGGYALVLTAAGVLYHRAIVWLVGRILPN